MGENNSRIEEILTEILDVLNRLVETREANEVMDFRQCAKFLGLKDPTSVYRLRLPVSRLKKEGGKKYYLKHRILEVLEKNEYYPDGKAEEVFQRAPNLMNQPQKSKANKKGNLL